MEVVYLSLRLEKELIFEDARKIRGFFGDYYKNRPEFHHHGEKGLIYHHPLIQYKVVNGEALITGLQGGAFILLGADKMDAINIDGMDIKVLGQRIDRGKVDFGLSEKKARYRFLTPWLPLNSINNLKFKKLKNRTNKVNELLSNILIGNIISLSKSVKYTIPNHLFISVDVCSSNYFTLKPGIKMLGFGGSFEINFKLPDLWGIGKSSSRGFGTVMYEEL